MIFFIRDLLYKIKGGGLSVNSVLCIDILYNYCCCIDCGNTHVCVCLVAHKADH